jgi:hypothetical protein
MLSKTFVKTVLMDVVDFLALLMSMRNIYIYIYIYIYMCVCMYVCACVCARVAICKKNTAC